MRRSSLVLVSVLAAAALVACGDDEDDGADAAPDPAAAQEAFCDDGASHVKALDAFGSLLDDDAATIGELRESAAALDATRAEVEESASQVGESAAAAVDDDAVDAVRDAEDAFQDATEDVDESTPFTEAALEVSASGFRLQVAWAMLLSEAGCADDPSAVHARVASYTQALEQDLAEAGRYQGAIDGIYGPQVTAAVEGLQADHGLPVTGYPDRATTAALAEELATQETAEVAALQGLLAAAGAYTGPIDGVWSQAVSDAVALVQMQAGLEESGEVDPATLAALAALLRDAPEETTTTTTTAAPATTTTTAAPAPTTTTTAAP